jgi:transposase
VPVIDNDPESGVVMDIRELKALELAARAKIIPGDDGTWRVPSQSTGGTYKVVTWPGAECCECEDWQLRQKAPFCKHLLAAKLVEEREKNRPAPAIDTDTAPKRKTYSQNWAAYDQAQTEEKHRLQVLLADLCAGLPELPTAETGRKPVAVADRIFSCAFKVYSGVSTRRYMCDMADAHEAGHLSRKVHFSKVSAFMMDADLTEPLRALVARSALPLKAIETDFAVDSTGFTTCRFVPWFDHKYGVTRRQHDWVKVHICTGVKTNVVTAVEVRDKDANDSPLLPPLVRKTAETFAVREVSADKAYLSVENVNLIDGVGGQAFIPPKSSTTGAAGGLFERMYHYYAFNREEFLRRYHKRSNVESTFSAIKRKFGDFIRSRNEVAMTNEVLCKIICHNLCCVILSQIELGIEAAFWGRGEDRANDVLPLARGFATRA